MRSVDSASPTLPSAAPAADTFGDDPLSGTAYRFVRPLGAGGMGEVVEAEHRALGSHVAVKLLRADHWGRFDLKDRMRIEAQACARLRHDNLVFVTDFGETPDGRVFVVMELLQGRSLADEIRARGALPPAEAIDIAAQALAGLSVAHAAGVLHRDLKPDNLFLCDLGSGARRVKVLDFGVAKIVDAGRTPQTPTPLAQATARGIMVGTPRYASPEQGRGEADLDARSDVYAMGWVLHTMLTGRPPFPDKMEPKALLHAQTNEAPPLPSREAPYPVPPELDRIVMKALSKRREDRYSSANLFREDLIRLEGEGAAPRLGAAIGRTGEMAPAVAALLPAGQPMPVETVEMEPPRGRGGNAGPARILPVLVCAAIVVAGVTLAVALRLAGIV